MRVESIILFERISCSAVLCARPYESMHSHNDAIFCGTARDSF